MSYMMRTRKQENIYANDWCSSDDEDYDSSYSDPDYIRTRQERRSRRTNVVLNPSIDNPMQNNSPAAAAPGGGVASSIRNDGIVLGVAAPRRPPGRPPRERVRVEERPMRRRRRSLSLRKPRVSNWINREENVEKKKTILSWLIDLGLIKENLRVWYVDPASKDRRQEGYIKREGVLCDCCARVITVYEFEKHANCGNLKEPYANIYFPYGGASLLFCMKKVWEKLPEDLSGRKYNLVRPRRNATDENDDACMICADGGNLICCEQCPSTFHKNCMFMQNVPEGDWLCPFCVCLFCSTGGCANATLHACMQCEKRFHLECLLKKQLLHLYCPISFCGESCCQVFTGIQQKFLGVRNELGNGYSWSLVRMIKEGQPHSNLDSHKIEVCNCKVAIAWTVMDEIFLTSIDRHAAIDIVQSVVYNRESNLMRLNFKGFYTAVLEKNDEIVSVASLRVHGNKIAEMPFIGTRERFRNKGMLLKLFTEIESALRLLKVENLVIPSVPYLVPMWVQKYGFSPVGSDLMRDLINYNTLMFPSAVRLHKSLVANAAGPSVVNVLANATAEPSVVAAMEVVGAKNYETGQTQDNNSRKVALFDLNLEPPEDDDDA